MSLISNTALAFSMSADAFAAAISKGATFDKPKLSDALRTGAIFGVIEAITPVIGWALGLAASTIIASFDHWLAFLILCGIGLSMIYESLNEEQPSETGDKNGISKIILTAIGTSIDAMAVGVTLALLDADIIVSALSIGFATFLMATVGILFGHYMGQKVGRAAEGLGGVGLILIGISILFDHMNVFS
jgi:putative Mn2+ efflux pump MntP